MKQHPLIKRFADRCRQRGASIYVGRNFLVARWESGDRFEVRVDEKR